MKSRNPNEIPRVRAMNDGGKPLDVMSKMVVHHVDGKTTIADIAEACGIDIDLAQRIINDLMDRRLIELSTPEQEIRSVVRPSSPIIDRAAPRGDETQRVGSRAKLKAEIESMYGSLHSSNYYDLLGVEFEADFQQVRKRYFELSKVYHPDRAFGEGAEAFRRKMEVIFRRLTKAYETLSNSKLREEYDEYIADQIEIHSIEKNLLSAIDSTRTRKAKSSRPPVVSAPRERQSSIGLSRPAGEDSVSQRTSSGSISSRITRPGRRASTSKSEKKTPSLPPDHQKRRKKWQRERVGRALANVLRTSRSSAPPPSSQVKEKLEDAALAFEQERFTEAMRILRGLVAADPKNKAAKEMLAKAQEASVKALAQGYMRQGRYELMNGQADQALAHFEKALEVESNNIDVRHLIADLLLKEKKDLARALLLAKEVIKMGGNRARYFGTLGELYLLAKDNERASEAYQKALALEPGNKEYRKRLKACKN